MKGRGFNKGLFLFVLLALCLLVICQLTAQEVVKNRARFFSIYKKYYFDTPKDSITVTYHETSVNNIKYEAAKKRVGLPDGYLKLFKDNRQLYLLTVIWVVKHWQKIDNGYIYRMAIVEFVVRSGRYMPAESFIVEYPFHTHIHEKSCGKIERLKYEHQ